MRRFQEVRKTKKGRGLFSLGPRLEGFPSQGRRCLDRLLEGVARAEGGNLGGRDLHLLTGLGVPTLPGLALPDGELLASRVLHAGSIVMTNAVGEFG
jgi:hypothetical protein